jgi:hypothetical protein
MNYLCHSLDRFNGPANVVALGFDTTEEEMEQYLKIVGGAQLKFSYFSRKRSDDEVKDLTKAFKLSPGEIDPSSHEHMAQAVTHRVATKFIA